jgi:hypothetical protein
VAAGPRGGRAGRQRRLTARKNLFYFSVPEVPVRFCYAEPVADQVGKLRRYADDVIGKVRN